MRRPLECALCGMPRWNDETVHWVAGLPYCASGCAETAQTLIEVSR